MTTEKEIEPAKNEIEILEDFHKKIVESQQDLDNEFAKILYDNLWNLY